MKFKLKTAEKFLPVIFDVQKFKYGAQVILWNGKVYLHIQVPFKIYLKHLGKTAKGRLYAVTFTLVQIMMEKAREKAKIITPEEAKARSRQALQKLLSGEIEDEWSEVKEILEEADKK